MFKMRRVAVLAVVVLGLVALAVPAGASANKRTNQDIKRLGDNVNELRKKTDEMNRTISQLASVAGSSLTQLRDGLVTLSDTTANFKYGVVQVGTAATPGVAGVGPTHFFVTPPIYKTGAQSTVTFNVPQTASLGLGGSLKLLTGVRSVNPDSGSVACRMTTTPFAVANGLGFATWRQNSTDGLFVRMPQSRIQPQNGNPNFPIGLVATEDNVLDLADPQYSASLADIATFAQAGTPAPTPARPTTTGGISVTLSCLRTS